MSPSKQEVRGSRISGQVTQASDVSNTDQTATNIEATELNQTISSQQQSLSLGKYRAKGIYAIVGLVILVVVYLLIQFLMKK